MGNLWDTLQQLKTLKWIELSHSLNNDSPIWSGMPEGVLEIGKTVYDYDQELNLKIQTFKFPGQFGTHVDFPSHFCEKGVGSEHFGITDMVLPMVVLDVSQKVKANPDYEVTPEDITEHETKYGIIPEGSFVALRTDWSKRWPDGDALANLDDKGNEHAPGWTLETLKFLYETRKIAGSGHETLDTDASVGFMRSGDLICERYILDKSKFQVEVLNNLDLLPPVGAIIFVAVPRIEGATGLPARVWAIVDDK